MKYSKNKTTYIDCNDTIEEYINKEDWRIKANSNQEPFQYRKFVKNIGVRVRF